MMFRFILVSLLLISFATGGSWAQNDCYDYDTDLTGPDLVNGLNNKQGSAEECQAVCRDNYAGR